MDEQEEQPVRECRKCDVAWGLAGVLFGALMLAIGADLITRGALTRVLTGGRNLADIPTGEIPDDDAA
jgi:hypothetical protein